MAFRKSPSTRASANESRPQISAVSPAAAIPGGDFLIRGSGLANGGRPHIHFGRTRAQIVVGSDDFVIVRVPPGASNGEMFVGADPDASAGWPCRVGVPIASGVHPVSNPVVNRAGEIFVTFSGGAGVKTPISVYKIDTALDSKPLVTDIVNATGLAFDDEETLYVSSRSDGLVYQVSPAGNTSIYVEGMGVATGIVFDRDGNLYVGDRSGTIFKISRQRQIYVFATLEPSLAAYHLAFGPEDYLYVSGPTTSSFDSIARISHTGQVERFYRGLGRPQGMAFDADGNLYVAASLGGRRGIVRITPETEAELFLSGPSIVGLAFTPSKGLIVATNDSSPSRGPEGSLYRVNAGIQGRVTH
jgi:sugar lactone lactonase YvrE